MRTLRRLSWRAVLCGVALLPLAGSHGAEQQPEIVVAIRYLQGSGTSHSHLYLYREDGKPLRQLTRDDGGQDRNPVFQPDGENIVFTRELPGDVKQWWLVSPRGENLARLAAPPDWYTETKSSPSFTDNSVQEATVDRVAAQATPALPINRLAETEAGKPRVYPAPEGIGQIVVTPDPAEDQDEPDKWEVGLRRAPGAPETVVGPLAGYSVNLLGCPGPDGSRRTALVEGALRVAFLFTHLNSSDGNTVHALDFNGKRLVGLSPNWASPFPLPGEAAFLTLTEERYVPFGDGQHTANCSYVDRWDAGLKRVRYAREQAPATCYGASMFRAGRTPATVNVLVTEPE